MPEDTKPDNQENNRNTNGTFKPGVSGNPAGRPRGSTLKEYQANKFRSMSDEEKDEYLSDVAKIERWRMSEGNPHSTEDSKVEGTIKHYTITVGEGTMDNQVETAVVDEVVAPVETNELTNEPLQSPSEPTENTPVEETV